MRSHLEVPVRKGKKINFFHIFHNYGKTIYAMAIEPKKGMTRA